MPRHATPARVLSPRVERRLMRVATALAVVTLTLTIAGLVLTAVVGVR